MAEESYDAVMTPEQFKSTYGSAEKTEADSFDAVMTPEEYKTTYGSDWNLGGSAENFASGVVEGTVGLGGLAADLFSYPSRLVAATGEENFPKVFPVSEAASKALDPLLAAKDPKYRYARTLGQFVGPGGALGAAGKVIKGIRGTSVLTDWLMTQMAPKAAIEATGAAIGAQAAEDLTGDKKVAPLVGALFGGVTPSVLSSGGSATRSLFRGATPDEVKGSAALAFKELTGLTTKEVKEAIKTRPKDDLGQLMTTAEVTGNSAVAQIEKTLSATDDAARIYNARAELREQAREALLEKASTTKAINKEGLGAALLEKARSVQKLMGEGAELLWKKVPRDADVDVSEGQSIINSIIERRQAGLPLDRKVRELVDQFTSTKLNANSGGPVRTSGALQDIRSDALTVLRESKLTAHEEQILGSLQAEIDNAMGKGLLGDDYDVWRAAREATAIKAETFKRGTAGGALTEAMARQQNLLSNAIRGDSKSIRELKAAIGGDPALLEDVKRGFVDSIPRDAQGALTANKMKSFLMANEGALKELFGKEHHSSLLRILQDLQSEARVGQKAFRSSKGNSVTNQRGTVAGVIQETMLGSLIPGSGTLSKIADNVKKAANIRDAKGVQELLFRAAMDPAFALELSKTPTNTRIFSALDRLYNAVDDAGKTAGTVTALELSRTEDNRKIEPNIGIGVKKKVQ